MQTSGSSHESTRPQQLGIVLLVWRRASYLRVTLELLRKARGIGNVTLVVSHDGLYAEVAEEIDNIDFCRVKELIYPWNRQWLDDLRGGKGQPWKSSVANAIGLPIEEGAGFLKHSFLCTSLCQLIVVIPDRC